MLYFTNEWASGALADERIDEVVREYERYIDTLDRTGNVWRFATTVSLNDAYLDRVSVEGQRLTLLLLTGDLQVGYWHTELNYDGACIVHGQDILRQALQDRPTEVWYDEFSGHLPSMNHSFLLAPKADGLKAGGEFQIEFGEFAFTQSPARGRTLSAPSDQSRWV